MTFGNWKKCGLLGLLACLSLGFSGAASAGVMTVRVSVENLAPANTVGFAPLRLGFHNGTFDSFNTGAAAGDAIISVAEGGSGSDWFPEFAAAEPNAVLGTVLPDPPGPLVPGGTGFQDFTFATMVIPSNDLFLGNDNPMAFELFDAAGNLLINEILQTAGQIWDANSEVADPANADFVMGGNNDLRTPENGVVAFDFSELSEFNGLTTGAGYVFDSSGLTDATQVYRISFSQVAAVPEPGSFALLGSAAVFLTGCQIRRRRAARNAT